MLIKSFSRVKSTRNVPTRNRYSFRFRGEFLHVTGEIDLQRIQSPANIAPLLSW